jgi:hypothetical protein
MKFDRITLKSLESNGAFFKTGDLVKYKTAMLEADPGWSALVLTDWNWYEKKPGEMFISVMDCDGSRHFVRYFDIEKVV